LLGGKLKKVIIQSKNNEKREEDRTLEVLAERYKGFSACKVAELFNLLGENPTFDNEHPQRLLTFGQQTLTLEEHGFIGYAVNFIYLTPEQLQRDLRRKVWYSLLWKAMIFTTRQKALNFQSRNPRAKIISLDGYTYDGLGTHYVGEPNDRNQDSLPLLEGLAADERIGWGILTANKAKLEASLEKSQKRKKSFPELKNKFEVEMELLASKRKEKAEMDQILAELSLEITQLSKQIETIEAGDSNLKRKKPKK
jgi:chromosome segregation ATPase